jgi:TolB protein
MSKHTFFKATIAVAGLILATSAVAQPLQGTVYGSSPPGKTPPIWVSISGFTGEALQALQFDLYVQGFNFTNAEGAQYLLSGSNNGNLQGRATDRILNRTIVPSKVYSGSTLRRQVHWFADDFVNAVPQQKGIARTKIAFKVDTGANSEIYAADFDGQSAQPVTADNTIVAAPCWVPGKLALYYTSYKLGNPDIFYHDLLNGQRNVYAKYPGLNSSAAVSPDGRRVAMILSKSGSPDVYVCDADGSNLKRLTSTREDESSPCWSPDGQWICFATKINNGRRALCKVSVMGGSVQTVATPAVLNPTEPDWSPDGKLIAFTSQMGNFQICVVPAGGGSVTELVAGADPSWSANSRTLVFTREENHRRILSLLDVPTKQVKDVSRVSTGNNSQPSWAR